MNRTTRSYLRAVKRGIPLCDMRKRVIRTLKPACEIFETEQPNADRSALYERFGTPEQIARNALENTEPDILYRSLTRTRRTWIVSLVVAALIVIGFWLAFTIASCKVCLSSPGYYIESLIYEVSP